MRKSQVPGAMARGFAGGNICIPREGAAVRGCPQHVPTWSSAHFGAREGRSLHTRTKRCPEVLLRISTPDVAKQPGSVLLLQSTTPRIKQLFPPLTWIKDIWISLNLSIRSNKHACPSPIYSATWGKKSLYYFTAQCTRRLCCI